MADLGFAIYTVNSFVFKGKACVMTMLRMCFVKAAVVFVESLKPFLAIAHCFYIFSTRLAGNHWIRSMH